jgi:YidC/Oxa1 family membrane protein insertase
MEKFDPNMEYIKDYGIFSFLAMPLYKALNYIHGYVGNWGWAIILVTVLIKIIFYPLTRSSFRSMAKMRELSPQLKVLQERYKDDRQKLSQEMMALYKANKANPMGGCLPMLLQIPIFISLYNVLLVSIEIKGAPFVLWITDLSEKDPYYITPVLMGATMFLQQKISPPMGDPLQQKIMLLLPVVFTFLFLSFPAGLVVYWVVNNILTISQQWYIYKRVDAENAAKALANAAIKADKGVVDMENKKESESAKQTPRKKADRKKGQSKKRK